MYISKGGTYDVQDNVVVSCVVCVSYGICVWCGYPSLRRHARSHTAAPSHADLHHAASSRRRGHVPPAADGGLFGGALILGERIGWLQAVGSLVILFSIMLVNGYLEKPWRRLTASL